LRLLRGRITRWSFVLRERIQEHIKIFGQKARNGFWWDGRPACLFTCYDGWVAGTLYVPVPKAQEVYSLASLTINKAKNRVSARTNLLSLRDPDV
jgi:hypothetical protein